MVITFHYATSINTNANQIEKLLQPRLHYLVLSPRDTFKIISRSSYSLLALLIHFEFHFDFYFLFILTFKDFYTHFFPFLYDEFFFRLIFDLQKVVRGLKPVNLRLSSWKFCELQPLLSCSSLTQHCRS